MENKKLIFCCIAGIVLGYLAPKIIKTDQYVSLMVGLIAGLGVGFLLDEIDRKKASGKEQAVINEKASEAVRLMREARSRVESGETTNEDEIGSYEDEAPVSSGEEELPDAEEEAKKLAEAQDLIAAARERMKH